MKAAKKRAHGGDVESPKKGVVVGDQSPKTVYAGGDSNVVKEAKERRKGGSCYESGGKAMAKKAAAKVEGKKAMDRLDRPKRATGGKIGANEKPFSTAATTTNRPGGDVQEA
jgi:hypothetical protein